MAIVTLGVDLAKNVFALRLHFRGMNRLVIEFREPNADARVVLDIVQKLRTCFRVVADRLTAGSNGGLLRGLLRRE